MADAVVPAESLLFRRRLAVTKQQFLHVPTVVLDFGHLLDLCSSQPLGWRHAETQRAQLDLHRIGAIEVRPLQRYRQFVPAALQLAIRRTRRGCRAVCALEGIDVIDQLCPARIAAVEVKRIGQHAERENVRIAVLLLLPAAVVEQVEQRT